MPEHCCLLAVVTVEAGACWECHDSHCSFSQLIHMVVQSHVENCAEQLLDKANYVVQSFGKMGLGPRSAMPARPWGQRIGSNDKHNEWKLFIGQVPLEVRVWLTLSPPTGILHVSWLCMVPCLRMPCS